MGKWDLSRLGFKMSFGRLSNTAQPPWLCYPITELFLVNHVLLKQSSRKYFKILQQKMAEVEIFRICHFHFMSSEMKKKCKWYTCYFSSDFLMLAKLIDLKFPYIRYLDFTSDKTDLSPSFWKDCWKKFAPHKCILFCSSQSQTWIYGTVPQRIVSIYSHYLCCILVHTATIPWIFLIVSITSV